MDLFLEGVGWGGTAAIVLAYYLISCGKLKADGWLYHAMNLGGAVAVGLSAFPKRAWPAVGLEVIWALIALRALVQIQSVRSR